MKKDFIYIIIIALLIGVGYYQYDRAQSFKGSIQTEVKETKIWRDKAGLSVAEAEVWKGNYASFKIQHEGIVDSLKKTIGTGNVTQVVTLTREIHDTVTITRDSRGLISFSDRWTTFSQPELDKLSYMIRDSLSVTTFRKGSGFLGLKKTYVTEIRNANPNVSMTGARSFEIRPIDRRLGFGLSAGYAMTNNGLSPFVGAGVIYRLF